MPYPDFPVPQVPNPKMGGIGGGFGGLLGNPMFGAAMGLLSAGQNKAINPYQAALGGMMGSAQFKQQQDMLKLQKSLLESQITSSKRDAEVRKGVMTQAQQWIQNYDKRNGDVNGDGVVSQGERLAEPMMRMAALSGDTKAWQDAISEAYKAPEYVTRKTVTGAEELLDPYTLKAVGNKPTGLDRKPEDVYGQERSLREEFNRLTNNFRTQEEAYGRVIASVREPSPAGDLSLIFNYMKTLDPESVVRESEFAVAEATGPLMARLQNLYKRIEKGERLTPEQRVDFYIRARKLYAEGKAGFEKRRGQYIALAKQYPGVDPSRSVIGSPMYGEEDYYSIIEGLKQTETPESLDNWSDEDERRYRELLMKQGRQ